MKFKRRKQLGTALLTATFSFGVSVVGCVDNKDTDDSDDITISPFDSGFAGNLMAPPTVDFCIDVTPDDANVTVDGDPIADEECIQTFDGNNVRVEATAEGYLDYLEDVEVNNNTNHVFEMTPEGDQ